MNFSYAYIFLILASSLTIGCKDTIAPPAPERVAARPQPIRVASTIHMPIQVPLAEVVALINEVIPWKLYTGQDHPARKGIFRAKIDIEVRRNGPIRVEPTEGGILTHIPLRADGLVKSLGLKRPFSTTFTVHAQSKIRLDEKWQFISETKSHFTWRKEPKIKVLGVSFNAASAAGHAIKKRLQKLAPEIDEKLRTSVKIRDLVEKLWADLNKPIPVSEQPPAWLDIEPKSFHFSPVKIKADTAIFGLHTVTFMEMVMGQRPRDTPPDTLPPLQSTIDSTNAFHIDLAVSLPYQSASQILSAALAEKVFIVKKNVKVRVKGFDLYASGPSLVAGIDFEADVPWQYFSVTGQFFLKGIPVYNDQTRTIRIDSLQYDVESRNRLAEVAAWMLHERFLATLQERLVLPIGDEIELARDRLQTALDHRAIGKHVTIDGTIETLSPGRLYLSDDAIHVKVFANGQLQLGIKSLPEIKREKKVLPS